MSWGLVIAGGASVISSIYSSNKAADASEEGSDRSLELQARQYDQSRADLAPWRTHGGNALNAYARAMGLPQYDSYPSGAVAGSGHPLYGDGNQPLSEEGLRQAYQDVLGREIDPSGLQYYMNESVKRGGGGAPGSGNIIGQLGYFGSPGLSSLLGGDDKGSRGAFTFNEFLDATQGSDEYKQRVASGELKPFDRATAFQPQQQEFIGGSQTNPEDQYGGFKASPGYKFRLEEGNRGLDRNFAARGSYLSGAREKAAIRYNQNQASNEFGNYTNRLASIAGLGQTATGQQVNANQNYAAYGGRAIQDSADARASGYLAAGNAITSTGNNVLAALPYLRGRA